ncbi:MAG: ubiquinone/menaquinone biosynthesis methyltransferase [Acidimicrobiia bacterium]|nr:ubiquinone/menaquinone biosynthesis methyltransferase [Acidimicrobiia bacterium]
MAAGSPRRANPGSGAATPGNLGSAFDTADGKRRHVARLFATIANRYDLITRVLSYGQDRRWKRRLIDLAAVSATDRVLDVACGTGDLAFAAADRGARVVGLDLTPRMLELARQRRAGDAAVTFVAGDMAHLPFPPASFTLLTTGYGLRNAPDLPAAIAELHRVLAPGGRLCSLDFNRPEAPAIRWLYLSYLTVVGSALGWLLHRDPDTYRYIPASIRRYPGAGGVARLLEAAGFTRVRVVAVLGGLMTIHTAERAV